MADAGTGASGSGGRRRDTVLGFVLGAAVGVPAGFVFHMTTHRAVLPARLHSSDEILAAVVFLVALGLGLLGARRRWGSPSGSLLLRGAIGLVAGAVIGGVATFAGALVAWGLFGVTDRDGGFGQFALFVLAPLGAMSSGVAGAVLLMRRG